MTYYLLNDLTFTEEESAQVQMIGKYGTTTSSVKRLFDDVFDGKGHSLINLQFNAPVGGYYYAGLFSGISTTGSVKNLILGQAVYNKENDTKNAAFLAGINRGEINNCMLQNCTVEIIRDDSDFGNLVNWNEGIIINCHVDNVRLKNEIPQGNALTRYNQGGKSSTAQSPTVISVKLKTEAVSSAVSLKTEKF